MEGGVGIGGQAIAADVSQGVSVNAIDENLYQILWIAPHRGCLTCCAWNWENTSNTNTSNTSRATHTHPATSWSLCCQLNKSYIELKFISLFHFEIEQNILND